MQWNNDDEFEQCNNRTPSPPLFATGDENSAPLEPVITPRFRNIRASQNRASSEATPTNNLDAEEEKKRKGLLKQLIKSNAAATAPKQVPVKPKPSASTSTSISSAVPKPPATAPPPHRESPNLQARRAIGFNKRASFGTGANPTNTGMNRAESSRYSMRSSSVSAANRSTNSASVASKALNKTVSSAAAPKAIAVKESETMKLWLRRKEYNPMKAAADAKRNKSAAISSTTLQQRTAADDGDTKPSEEPVYLSK